VKLVEELGIPELTSEQVEELCSLAEKAARERILSKISAKKIEKLDISATVEGSKPVSLEVEVSIDLVPSVKNVDSQTLVEEALKDAFSVAREYLGRLKCRTKR
jgi:hypothetical protein